MNFLSALARVSVGAVSGMVLWGTLTILMGANSPSLYEAFKASLGFTMLAMALVGPLPFIFAALAVSMGKK